VARFEIAVADGRGTVSPCLLLPQSLLSLATI